MKAIKLTMDEWLITEALAGSLSAQKAMHEAMRECWSRITCNKAHAITQDADTAILVQAVAISRGSADVKEFVFLPAGDHEIFATVDGKPEKVTVKVDASVAGRLQADLTKRLAGNVQPFIDYDHARSKSAGRPKGFRWEPDKGVICQVEWTQAATSAIRDGEYTYFSPEFSYDRKNQTVKGLMASGPVGGLVNDPAFRAMPAVTAARSDNFPDPSSTENGPSPQHTKPTNNMPEKIVAALIAAGIISDTEAAQDAAPRMVVARFNEAKKAGEEGLKASHTTAIQQKDDQIKDLETKLTAAESTIKEVKEKEAAAAVTTAVQAGRIAPKDTATQDWWKAAILRDGESSVKALNAVAINPALKATNATTQEGADKKDGQMQCSSAEFEAMSPGQKMEFSKKGGRIQD